MKRLPMINAEDILGTFNHKNLTVFTDEKVLHQYLFDLNLRGSVLLLMSSGNFGHLDIKKFIKIKQA
jgi:UDP-N-acetylmuramate: L-alanyl-gamma-D-glutamyl-meso-diaminopimelate ligase